MFHTTIYDLLKLVVISRIVGLIFKCRHLGFQTVLDYLDNYKNPCWFEEDTTVHGIRCLPYVYILGVAKSGTTSLYTHIIRHKHVTKRQAKEIFWWGKVKSSKFS